MTNVERYRQILAKREVLNRQTKAMETKIYSINGESSVAEVRKWHTIELKRRDLSYQAALAWQTLTPDERREESSRYKD